MASPYSFRSRIEAEIAEGLDERARQREQAARTAETAAALAEIAERRQARREVRQAPAATRRQTREDYLHGLLALQVEHEGDRARAGTPPGLVWGRGAAAACQEFVGFVREHAYRGSVVLRHDEVDEGDDAWQTAGYRVGLTNGLETYLGNDNRLRVYALQGAVRSVRRDRLERASGLQLDISDIYDYTALPETGPREDYDIFDLPLDVNGRPMTPTTGLFAETFTPAPLDEVLLGYARAAGLGLADIPDLGPAA